MTAALGQIGKSKRKMPQLFLGTMEVVEQMCLAQRKTKVDILQLKRWRVHNNNRAGAGARILQEVSHKLTAHVPPGLGEDESGVGVKR